MDYRNARALMSTQSVLTILLVLAANMAGNLAYSQSGQLSLPSSIDIDDPRPVGKAVETLVARYGYVITYEDPRHTYEGDLQDVTTLVRSDLDKYPPGRATKVMVPRGGSITLELPQSASANTQTIAFALAQLMRAQSSRGEGGHFVVVQEADVFHVVPTEVRDRNGNWISQGSILDVLISFPKEARSEAEMIDAIVKAVSVEAHVTVHIGNGVGRGIFNPDQRQPYYLGANKERARDVLMRALILLNDPKNGTWIVQRLRWQLLYDSSDKAYFLSFATVPDRLSSPPLLNSLQNVSASSSAGSRLKQSHAEVNATTTQK